MKTRNCFVSNSSSSSYIYYPEKFVLKDSVVEEFKRGMNDGYYVIKKGSYREFGWEFEKYKDMESKIDWFILNVVYHFNRGNSSSPEKMRFEKDYDDYMKEVNREIRNIIQGKFRGFDIRAILKEICDGDAYIDHQSINFDEFKNPKVVINFIFSEKSYIETGNDNEEAPY